MTDLVDPETGVTPERRPRVKLEELPRGQGWLIGIVVMILVFMAVGALALGALRATGNIEKPLSENVWLAQQRDAQVELQEQTYEDYKADLGHEDAVSGTIVMAIGAPLALLLALMLWWGAVSDVVKCPKGHVVNKAHSYCPVCAAVIYTREELPPADWNKRYEASGGVH